MDFVIDDGLGSLVIDPEGAQRVESPEGSR